MEESDSIEEAPVEGPPSTIPKKANCKEEGVPISEAILVFGEPETVARYEKLKQSNEGKPRTVTKRRGNFIYTGYSNSLVEEEDNLKSKLWKGLCLKLSTRTLIASGVKYPVDDPININRQDLSHELWRFLRLLGSNGVKVRGQKLLFYDVRVRVPAAKRSSDVSAPPIDAPEHSPTAKQRTKRNKVRLYEEELIQRSDAGPLERTWGRQYRALAEWFEKTHADKEPAAEKTLRNQLKPLYDKLLQKHLTK